MYESGTMEAAPNTLPLLKTKELAVKRTFINTSLNDLINTSTALNYSIAGLHPGLRIEHTKYTSMYSL